MPAESPPSRRATNSTSIGRRERGEDAGGDRQRDAEHQHHLAPVAVAERPEVEHGGGEAERVADRDEVERRSATRRTRLPMSGRATLATARFRLATAATRISAAGPAPRAARCLVSLGHQVTASAVVDARAEHAVGPGLIEQHERHEHGGGDGHHLQRVRARGGAGDRQAVGGVGAGDQHVREQVHEQRAERRGHRGRRRGERPALAPGAQQRARGEHGDGREHAQHRRRPRGEDGEATSARPRTRTPIARERSRTAPVVFKARNAAPCSTESDSSVSPVHTP